MELPLLTCNILTYKRPWYAIQTLSRLISHIRYTGEKRYVVIDGGSPAWHLDMYREVLQHESYEIVQDHSDQTGQLVNLAADHGGEVWITALDDFMPERSINVTTDVEFLLNQPDVGHIRYGRMQSWNPDYKIYAELRMQYSQGYWVIDKSRSFLDYVWTMGFSMMHRRMWDAYGPCPNMPPHQPGETELQLNSHFKERSGPTVAVPVYIGQESDTYLPLGEFINHMGHVRTDEYSNQKGVSRWGAT